jgi:hypothetical protein
MAAEIGNVQPWLGSMLQHSEFLLNTRNAKSFLAGTIVGIMIVYISRIIAARYGGKKGPSRLSDPLPFVYNSIQFIFSNKHFLSRVS